MLKKEPIDGLLCRSVPLYGWVADMLGVRHPRLVNVIDGAGRISAVSIQIAAAAIQV